MRASGSRSSTAASPTTAPRWRASGRAALAGSDGAAALRLGDAYYGYGEYGPAAELYRAALQKGGQDANLVNTRLGAALALAGQRAEAEAAFRAVTGARAELAQILAALAVEPRELSGMGTVTSGQSLVTVPIPAVPLCDAAKMALPRRGPAG